jgi:glutamate---cysteine ligase / carboxylate-amine ligase
MQEAVGERFDDSDRWESGGGEARLLALRCERGFSSEPSLTVGLEEELILVDADSLLPVDAVDWVLAEVGRDARFKPEFRASQIELCTPVCLTCGDACRELTSARAHLLERIAGKLRLLAVGTHPLSAVASAVTDRDRFRGIAAGAAWATRRGQPSGLHVHVGLGDPREALAVYNAVRSYLPELAALAANSPFFEGHPSGLASTRLKLSEDLPRSGIPPAFASWEDLAEFVVWAARGRLFPDLSYLWWDLRPRPDYGTLELRIADVQTTPADAAAVAAVWQTLVAALADRFKRGEPLPVHKTYRLNENRWRALRDGLDGELVDPATGRAEPTRDRIGRLLYELAPYADELGCADQLAHAWSLRSENGANRQRKVAAERGPRGLLEWLADESERPPELGADHPRLTPQDLLVPPTAAASAAG